MKFKTKLQEDIFNMKYRYTDDEGNSETYPEWLDRVTNGDSRLRKIIEENKFLFGGRILANRGLQYKGKKISFSNCYVIGHPEDTLESIFECAKKLAKTYSYGGGCGIDLSYLRPNHAKVNNAAKESSGAVSFMDLYNLVTSLISQNGRRGALMMFMKSSHPDIEEFIKIKSDLDKIQKANISVGVENDFMEAVQKEGTYTLHFETETGEVIEKTVNAKDLMNLICFNAWDMGDPGVLFWDNITEYNMLNTYEDFKFDGTNPCAEEPLPAGGSCLLGAINLSEFVDNQFTNEAKFNTNSFANTVEIAVRALNKVLDEGMELHPLREQRESVRDWRQIGLGIMGFGDMLIKMGISYGSEECISLINEIGSLLANQAFETSCYLAQEMGEFPRCDRYKTANSAYVKAVIKKDNLDMLRAYGIRNSQLLTIAPTGSISTMLGISGGIEPLYDISYWRKTESLKGHDEYYECYSQIVLDWIKANYPGITDEDFSDEDRFKRVKELVELPDYIVKSTAKELDYMNRVKVQATWQKYIDASISSTVNLPNSATVQDIENIYVGAWKLGCKGITVFRDGCRRLGVLSTENKEGKTEDSNVDKDVDNVNKSGVSLAVNGDMTIVGNITDKSELRFGDTIPSSDNNCIGLKRKLTTGCGHLWVTAYFDMVNAELREVFLSKGSSGGCLSFMNGLSRTVSLLARKGASCEEIVDQLKSVTACPSYAVARAKTGDTSVGNSCPVAIGYALEDLHRDAVQLIVKDIVKRKINEHTKVTIENDSVVAEVSDDASSAKTVLDKTGLYAKISVDSEKLVDGVVAELNNVGLLPKCPSCGKDLAMVEGCVTCRSCGYSKC